MQRIFGDPLQDKCQNEMLIQLKNDLHQKQAVVDRVFIHFVFNGDPKAAENSTTIQNLREDLEARKDLINSYFHRDEVTLTVAYVPNQTKKVTGISHISTTLRHTITFHASSCITAPSKDILYMGFVTLLDLVQLYEKMSNRLFERNIRAAKEIGGVGYPITYLGAFCGMRRSEALGLRFLAVRWLDKEVRVQCSISKRLCQDGVHKWEWYLGPRRRANRSAASRQPKAS